VLIAQFSKTLDRIAAPRWEENNFILLFVRAGANLYLYHLFAVQSREKSSAILQDFWQLNFGEKIERREREIVAPQA
jgi:hypothetical protein